MKKYLAICAVSALVSISQATTVLFQEDFSGYAATSNSLPAPQVGTWTQIDGTINIATNHTLLDGTVGSCMEFVDDDGSFARLSANFIPYTASPIRITYDFLMRRTHIDPQQFSVQTVAANEGVTYWRTEAANGTQDWYQLRDNGDANNVSGYYARDSWYTMEMELPVMPASGQFTMKYTVHNAAGHLVYTADLLSWSASAGADLVDELLFRGGWGGAHQSSMLIDNILVETIHVPPTQPPILFQEDFSGYTEATNALAVPQIGTWTQNAGTLNIAITNHTLLDGTVGPCMEFVDDSASFPTLSANFIPYIVSPIRITYDFLMRRTAIDNQDFSVMTEAANEAVTYYKTSDANGTQDWIQLRDNGDANSITTYYAKDSWYTMEMELPVMPASGQFTMKYTIYDDTGTSIYTNEMLSWSASAGADLVDELVFRGGWGGVHQSSMLIDNILVETLSSGPTPEIGDIAVEYLGASGLALTWNTGIGHNYMVWEMADLISSTWSTNQSGIPGGAGSVTVTTAVDAVQAFYKVTSE